MEIFNFGILNDLSHPYEFLDSSLSTVSLPATAETCCGKYPPALEVTFIICLPSSSVTAFAVVTAFTSELCFP